jgi:hypothetical protein
MFKILRIGELEPLSIKGFQKISDRVDFSPIYQRYGNIWSPEKKRLLIDTIINGFDIPKFYFNYFIEENNILNPKKAIYAVIDGKQRLQVILDFLNDKFALDSEFVFYENSSYNLKGLKFSQIAQAHSDIASIIENYILDIIYVITDEEDKLEELFLRLNGGAALTNAEKRNAIGGFLNRNIREIVENHSFFSSKVRFKNPRYQHQDLLTRLLFIEENNALLSLTNSSLDKFVRANSSENTDINLVLQRTNSALDTLQNMFQDNDILLKGKGIIPVYYFFVTRHTPNLQNVRKFLEQFENIRLENRNALEEEQKPILIDFDRHNQQGVHRDKSLKERLNVLTRYYEKFLSDGQITIKTSVVTDDIEIDGDDEITEE